MKKVNLDPLSPAFDHEAVEAKIRDLNISSDKKKEWIEKTEQLNKDIEHFKNELGLEAPEAPDAWRDLEIGENLSLIHI